MPSSRLETLKIIPTAKQVNSTLVPPVLTKGRGWPVVGMAFTATPMLISILGSIGSIELLILIATLLKQIQLTGLV